MLSRFRAFISAHDLLSPDELLLVAVSGGIDSVVMLHLLVSAGYSCVVAHCNFCLRGKESDGDALFVKQLAERYKLAYHQNNFDTELYARQHGLSIQMAARELRYRWFEDLRQANHYQAIAVAHHADDAIETFLINFARGTGIKGLTGISVKNAYIVRPLLFAHRQEIEKYADKQGLNYREDSSNASDKYARNAIRHQLIPLFQKLNPAFLSSAQDSLHYLNQTAEIYQQAVGEAFRHCTIDTGDSINIMISRLKLLSPLDAYLYEFLKPYNFDNEMVKQISDALDAQPGKQFFSSTHHLLKDRDKLIISRIEKELSETYNIGADCRQLDIKDGERGSLRLVFEYEDYSSDYKIDANPRVAQLDADCLQFPLLLRRWQPGDRFRPLGMSNYKKLSDFFIDQKIPLTIKSNLWLLTSADDIVWLCAYRIDDRFKLTSKTKRVLKISYLKS